MANYYILSVDSYMDAFSAMDSAMAMNFSLQIQNHENVFDDVQTGDRLLVYRKSPVAKINMYFQVLGGMRTVCAFRKCSRSRVAFP